MVRPTLIDLNPVELKYYSFMISLDKCNESCSVLSPKICPPKKTKNVNVKVFNMITYKNEVKTVTKHTSFDYKCKFNSTKSNSNKKWNNKTCQYECNIHRKNKKDYILNPSTCTCENDKYLRRIADTLVITCDETITYGDCINKIDKRYGNKCVNKLS